MGKGNFILGTGSSSIGDVTFARRNGQQIARVRVRKIKNPKSYGQAEQRMISAEVVKFYSPLSGVLETSFEGLSKSESYAKFLSVNMNLARANAWPAKKGEVLPYPFQIAAGSLAQPNVADGVLQINAPGEGATMNMGTLSQLIIDKYDLQNGDQVTCIGWKENTNTEGLWTPKYFRFYLNTDSTDALPTEIEYDQAMGGMGFYGYQEHVAFIFSRWDGEKWARSNSFVFCSPDVLSTWVTPEKYAAAVASYMNAGGRTPISNVYLNGHDDE